VRSRPNIDQRADVYSLGVILFEMMTGKVPFGGEGYGEIIVKHITAPVPSPRAINPSSPLPTKRSFSAPWPRTAMSDSAAWRTFVSR